MKIKQSLLFFVLLICSGIFINSCKEYTNFTTYFNTYYNMERLTYEAEDEFEFQDEKKRIEPRIFIPQYPITIKEDNTVGPPPFMIEFIVTKQKRQPVGIKLDSIIIKGSKILAHKSKSNYVEGTLWLMAKAFFYQEDWVNSQIKCSELIDKFTDGDFSPDAHLLYSKNLLVQKKLAAGETMLSRTMDIAWQKNRWDILSEALRIKAELALYQEDFEKALIPYKQAISQSDDNDLKARWQLDMAALLFRINKFEMAQKEFKKVHNYSPDYVQRFEAYLYEASSMARLGKYEEADKILTALYKDGKYEEWQSYTYGQQLNVVRLKNLDSTYIYPLDDDGKKITVNIDSLEKFGDSAYANSNPMMSYFYEKAMEKYYQNDYKSARQLFAKTRQKRTPAYTTSMRMFDLLNNWDIAKNKVDPYLKRDLNNDSTVFPSDSLRMEVSSNLYTLGRIHEELGNKDSVEYYFKLATEVAPIDSAKSAQFFHNYARIIQEKEPFMADSLLDVIVTHHPLTEYGKDAQKQLGYTQNFVIDTVADLYNSGYNLMKFSDYEFAKKQFSEVYTTYPKSKFAPRSLYTLGWMFEKKMQRFDSAYYYYSILKENYPGSLYAQDIDLPILYKKIVDSGQEIPDSLKTKQITVMPAKIPLPEKGTPIQTLDPNKMQTFDPSKLFQEQKDMFNKAKEMFKNPSELMKELKLPENPLSNPKEFFNLEESKEKNDSTSNKTPTPERSNSEPPKK